MYAIGKVFIAMSDKISILDVPIDKVNMTDAVSKVLDYLNEDRVHTVFTPNPEMIMEAKRNPELKKALLLGDLVIPDGAGVVIGSRILGTNLPERVAGFDLIQNLFKVTRTPNLRFFFLGGQPGIAEDAAKKVIKVHPNIDVVGFLDGYFKNEYVSSIINNINSSNADILLVGLGAPKQELWINKYKDEINVKVCIGVGGSFDVLSGRAKRAPVFFQKNNIEWLYRLCKEPRRSIRMLDLPRFLFWVTVAKVKK